MADVSSAIVKLKGGEDSHFQKAMKTALGAKQQDTAEPDRRGGRGTIEPTPTAQSLGMPSAVSRAKRQQQQQNPNKDWSNSSNRINMGAPVYMKSKTSVDADYEDRGHVGEEKQLKLDAMEAGRLENLSDEEDDEFGGGADGGAVAQWRAARMAELQKKVAKTSEFLGLGHGGYTEIAQDDFLKEVTKSKYVVCHFYHPEYERCKIIDKHLEVLARKHLATKWIKMDANKSPFFVGKLQIKMLPTLVFFKDGIARDRMVGLDDMGEAGDAFTTEQLEKRIEKAGVIITGDKVTEEEIEDQKKTKNSIRQSNHNKGDSSEEDEDD